MQNWNEKCLSATVLNITIPHVQMMYSTVQDTCTRCTVHSTGHVHTMYSTVHSLMQTMYSTQTHAHDVQ